MGLPLIAPAEALSRKLTAPEDRASRRWAVKRDESFCGTVAIVFY
jgi:hypothetical protein